MLNNDKVLVNNVESVKEIGLLNGLDIIDVIFDILCIVSVIVFSIFIVYLLFSSVQTDEKDCVKFYKENHYVLDVCDKYKDKLEKGE